MFVYVRREDLHSAKWILCDEDLVPCLIVEEVDEMRVVAYVVKTEDGGPVVTTHSVHKDLLLCPETMSS